MPIIKINATIRKTIHYIITTPLALKTHTQYWPKAQVIDFHFTKHA